MPTPVPQHCPSSRELDDLELLISGALAPLTAFNTAGSPITLALPTGLAAAPVVELVDPEGLPLAEATLAADGSRNVRGLTLPQYGPFRRLYLTPEQVHQRFAGRTFVPVAGPITDAQLEQLLDLPARGAEVVFLALVGTGTPSLSPVALLRATLRVAESLRADVVAVPLASHDDAQGDHELGLRVVDVYAGSDAVVGLTDAGDPLPDLADIIDADQPPADEQGLVLFFTGLSGSGKSTLARALMDRLLEQGGRSVTSLDGDVVRRHLSAGLTFSKEDRETNIRRIGWVGAEIARHGGVAVCSPIAPFDATRQQVRQMVDEAGGAFFLVHVATPLEECERRDRKGLYAKARRGEIPEFTGISSPYEEPDDADVRVDTTGRTIDDALDDVVGALAEAGYLDLRPLSASESDPDPDETTGRGDAPLQVLFVCTANICRSPVMEYTARALAGNAPIAFSSAGTHGFDAQGVNQPMAELLAEQGIDSSGFRSRRITRAMIERSDLVITAEASHRTMLLADHPGQFRKVFTLGQLAEMLPGIDPGLSRAEFLSQLGQRRAMASPDLDVVDPYNRGPAAARACSEHVDRLLRVVVPRLAASARITA